MERPRLLRTYSGLRGRAGRRAGAGEGEGARLRLLPRAARWISPPADPKRFFSTSSSGGTASPASFASAASSLDDPDFRPPGRPQKARKPPARKAGKKRKGKGPPKENRPPPGGWKDGSEAPSSVPPDLCRNVTCRRRRQGAPVLSPIELQRAPLLCSTPELHCLSQLLTIRDSIQEEEEYAGSPGSRPCLDYSVYPRAALRELGQETHDCVLTQLSSLKMDAEAQETRGCLKHHGEEDVRNFQRKSLRVDSRRGPIVQQHFSQTPGSPFQSCSALQPRNIWGRTETSPVNQEDSLFPVAGKDYGSKLSVSAETNFVSPSPFRGVSQLQAKMCGGKIALSPPKTTAFLADKQQLNSPQELATPQMMAGKLNRVFSEGVNHCSIDQNSPRFQPVVVLGNQVVSEWLAQQSSRKQAVSHPLKRKQSFQSKTGTSVTRNNHQVVPTCNPGGTGRKACISGFSSKRWARHRNIGPVRHKKNVGWKQQADSFLLQERLKWNEMEDNLSFAVLPLDSSSKNSSLWRRIRASFSLHKKKKILSEAESFSSGTTSNLSTRSHLAEALHTPFTQKLGYSICPSSSMVLLSSMTSLSVPEAVLTDAEKVYGECQQKGPVSFEECIPPEKMQKCEKIGEGVFGEVFKTESERGTIALKIIPIEGSERVNGEAQKTFSEILPEIIISKELSLLADEAVNQTSGFIRLYSVHCVKGAYPEHLLNAWDEYHRLRESENDRPDFFGDQQLFMVLEFEFGGTDLENMRNRQLSSVAVAKSILHQVTASLAVAEEALHFEHRDLHWGNVLVRKTSLKEVTVTLNGESRVLPTQGVLVNIIDYTFSRLERDGLTVYCDLSADDEVFHGGGDYQFDIYRQMKEENANNWADYFPHSNILWLHYLADKLLKEVSYKKKPTTSSLKQTQKQLRMFSTEVLRFRSATELLNQGTFFQ